MVTPFSQLLQSAQGAGGTQTFEVPEDWMQGRSVFGGLQVALAAQVMRGLVPSAPLRTVQATFVAPVPEGPVKVQAELWRQGKSTTHVAARLGDGEVQAQVIGVFGAARPSVVAETPVRQPYAADVNLEFPFLPGLTPNFTQHFEVRWEHGGLPFTGVRSPEQHVTVSLRDQGPASEAALIAIADFVPPIGLSYLEAPAPGSTLTWMLELLRDRWDDLPLQGWKVDAKMVAARDGYTSQSVMIWAPDGTPAAVSHQSMLVFG